MEERQLRHPAYANKNFQRYPVFVANSEHVVKLHDDANAWNNWRRTDLRRRPDISDASLSHLDLRDFDLRFADLHGSRLPNAKLSRCAMHSADLSGCNLHATRLTGANLTGANLTRADLSLTHLDRANLRRTNLFRTQFRASRLAEADLREAVLNQTLFQNVDLSRVKGLSELLHKGPSFIDAQTLARSGPLPHQFLRGCGLPEHLIEYLPSIFSRPIEFYSCFISYSTKDQAFADRLYTDLQDNGVRCWFAPHHVKGGRKLHEQIDEAIRLYDRLLLILSGHSISSEWVKTEIAFAREKELNEGRQVLFPISLARFDKIRAWKCFDGDSGKDSAKEIREYFIPDFSDWGKDSAYQQALKSLPRISRLGEALLAANRQ